MSIMSIAIGVICTVLMVGAVIWVLILERKGNDESDNSVEDTRQKSDERPKEEKQ